VQWKEDTVASICASCLKSFGLIRRKHHCRLDGTVICNQCSRFLSFSIARKLSFYSYLFPKIILLLECISDHNISSSPIPQQLTDVTDITSSTMNNDGTNEDYLRICTSCGQYLQRFYNQIRFRNIEKDQIFHLYEVNYTYLFVI
jgi:rabenosyn-5